MRACRAEDRADELGRCFQKWLASKVVRISFCNAIIYVLVGCFCCYTLDEVCTESYFELIFGVHGIIATTRIDAA